VCATDNTLVIIPALSLRVNFNATMPSSQAVERRDLPFMIRWSCPMCAATSGTLNSASSHVGRAHADAPPGALREARAQLVQHRLQQSAPAFTVFVLTPHPPSPWSYLGVNTSKSTNTYKTRSSVPKSTYFELCVGDC
jgi:hypothetical protein